MEHTAPRWYTLKAYLPAIAMVVVAVLSYLYTALNDNQLSNQELVTCALTVLGAFTIYLLPRLTSVSWLKPVTAFLYAALELLVSHMTDGVSNQEWVLIILAGFGAIGVAATNKHVPYSE